VKRVVITRPPKQAEALAELLRKSGFEPIFFPVIEIAPADPQPLDEALQSLDSFDWLVLTSANGVKAVWERLEALQVATLPAKLRIAVIGPKTAQALREVGVQPDFVPDEYVAEAILPGLGDVGGKRILLARADIARKALADAIREAGGEAVEITAYRNVPAEAYPLGLEAIRLGVDAITLTSASTAHGFVSQMRAAGNDPRALPGNPLYACIGPITADAAIIEGLTVTLVAEEYTIEGLVNRLKEQLNSPDPLSS
jgi:uroporphyrinogen III methyltransferase/synthase